MEKKEVYLVYGLDYVAKFKEDLMYGRPSFTRVFDERKKAINFLKEKCLCCFFEIQKYGLFEEKSEEDIFINTYIPDKYYDPFFKPEPNFGEYIIYTENEDLVTWMPIFHYARGDLDGFVYTYPKVYMKKIVVE